MLNFNQYLDQTLSFKESLEMNPFPILIGKDGYFLYGNQLALALLEADQVEQIIGKTVFEFTHPNSILETRNNLEEIKRTKRQEPSIKNIITLKNNLLEIESVVIQISLFNEKFDYIVVKDSTPIKALTQSYLIQNKHYQTLIDNSIDTVALISYDHVFKYINKAGLRLFGAQEEKEVIGKSVFDFIHPRHHEDISSRTEKVTKNQAIGSAKERQLTRLDGSIRYVESVVMPFMIGNVPSLQVILRDITEQKQNLEHLIQSEKLLTAGQLSAGIAHEIRNPLTSIKGFLQFIEGTIPEENHMYTAIMKDEIEKIDRITGEMLSLSKPQAYHYSEHNLNLLIEEVITLLNPQAMLKNVQLQNESRGKQVLFNCDKQQIKQVFINLIKNAIEAMDYGGLVSVKTEMSEDHISIQITDQGYGIPKDLLSKIHDPFFTTKGTGTGLGLTICNAIIKDYQGKLLVNSEENKGTKITIKFPANNVSMKKPG